MSGAMMVFDIVELHHHPSHQYDRRGRRRRLRKRVAAVWTPRRSEKNCSIIEWDNHKIMVKISIKSNKLNGLHFSTYLHIERGRWHKYSHGISIVLWGSFFNIDFLFSSRQLKDQFLEFLLKFLKECH